MIEDCFAQIQIIHSVLSQSKVILSTLRSISLIPGKLFICYIYTIFLLLSFPGTALTESPNEHSIENQTENEKTLSDYNIDDPIFIGEEEFLNSLSQIKSKSTHRDNIRSSAASSNPINNNLNTADSTNYQPLGLLLSGGSARAFAHIGVLKKMEEENIYPDFIVANSMGAIIGMLYAAGLSPDTIYEVIGSINLPDLFDPTTPINRGILSSRKLTAALYYLLGPLDLADLPIPIIILCDDLITKRPVWVAKGDFYAILEASFAMPLYFTPVNFKGYKLIDGGASNLVPVSVAYEFTDRVIASTTFYDAAMNFDNPITVLMRSMSIAKERPGIQELKYYQPHIIRCDVEHISFMDFNNLDEIVSAGYTSAGRALGRFGHLIGETHPSVSLLESRKLHRQNFKPFIKQFSLGTRYPILNPFVGLQGGVVFPDSFNRRSYLITEPYLYLGLQAEIGHLNTSLGGTKNLLSQVEGALGSFSFDYYNYFTFYTSGMLLLEQSGLPYTGNLKSFYTYNRGQSSFHLPYPLQWDLFITAEALFDLQAKEDPQQEQEQEAQTEFVFDQAFFHRVGALIKREDKNSIVSAAFKGYGFLFNQQYEHRDINENEDENGGDGTGHGNEDANDNGKGLWFEKGQVVPGLGAEVALELLKPGRSTWPLSLRFRGVGRYAFQGQAPLFVRDGYRGVINQNSDSADTSQITDGTGGAFGAGAAGVINLDALDNTNEETIGYYNRPLLFLIAPEFGLNYSNLAISLGEMLIIQQLDGFFFYDALLYTDHENEFILRQTAGAGLTCSLSLIGLTPITASIQVGYDFTLDAPRISFSLGNRFNL